MRRLPIIIGSAHGFTLAEVLLSLAVLSALATAIASWTTTTARGVSNATEPLAWEAAAAAALERMGRDLIAGDFAMPEESQGHNATPPPLGISWSKEGVLAVLTRASGPCLRSYLVDPHTAALVVREITESSGDVSERLLIRNVDDFTCVIDEATRQLDVSIVGTAGRHVERSYRVP